ncbi:hypothetical protein C9890_0012 [Perkinsus sp. BL_2016]|nr:hypothetical protein C9890_0012 [Perkinsus sp. BL_2016]
MGKFFSEISEKLNLLGQQIAQTWPLVETHDYLQRLLEIPKIFFPLRVLLTCRLSGQQQKSKLLALLEATEAPKFNANLLISSFLPQDSKVNWELLSALESNVELYESSSAHYTCWSRHNFRTLAQGLETPEFERWLRVLLRVVHRRPEAMSMVWTTCVQAYRKIFSTRSSLSDPGLESSFLEILAWRGTASPEDLRLALRELLIRGSFAFESWMGAYFQPLLELTPSCSGLAELSTQLLEICVLNFARLPAEGHRFLQQLLKHLEVPPPGALLEAVLTIGKRRRLSPEEWNVALLLTKTQKQSVKLLVNLALEELEACLADHDLEIYSLRATAQLLRMQEETDCKSSPTFLRLATELLGMLETPARCEGLSETVLDMMIEICQILIARLKNQQLLVRLHSLPDAECQLLLRLSLAREGMEMVTVVEDIFECLYDNDFDAEVLDAISGRFVEICRKSWTNENCECLKALLLQRLMEPIESPFRPRLLLEFFQHGHTEFFHTLLQSTNSHAREISVLSSRSRRDVFQVETVDKVLAVLDVYVDGVEDEQILSFVATAMFVTTVPERMRNLVFVALANLAMKLSESDQLMWPQLFLAGAGALVVRAGLRAAQRANGKLPNLAMMPDLSALRGLEGFGGSPMGKAEAVRILNIAPQQALDPEKIREVHRRLLLANHPDRGGSTFISTKINEAKETLMGKKK